MTGGEDGSTVFTVQPEQRDTQILSGGTDMTAAVTLQLHK
jgi:hypothetical protein